MNDSESESDTDIEEITLRNVHGRIIFFVFLSHWLHRDAVCIWIWHIWHMAPPFLHYSITKDTK